MITPNDEFHLNLRISPSDLVEEKHYLICGHLTTLENGEITYNGNEGPNEEQDYVVFIKKSKNHSGIIVYLCSSSSY